MLWLWLSLSVTVTVIINVLTHSLVLDFSSMWLNTSRSDVTALFVILWTHLIIFSTAADVSGTNTKISAAVGIGVGCQKAIQSKVILCPHRSCSSDYHHVERCPVL
jgi:hypothetical protein